MKWKLKSTNTKSNGNSLDLDLKIVFQVPPSLRGGPPFIFFLDWTLPANPLGKWRLSLFLPFIPLVSGPEHRISQPKGIPTRRSRAMRRLRSLSLYLTLAASIVYPACSNQFFDYPLYLNPVAQPGNIRGLSLCCLYPNAWLGSSRTF